MADTQLFRFSLGEHTRGFAAPLRADRVGLNFLVPNAATNIAMSSAEARAIANALYEAADAAEKVLPVAKAVA